MSLGRLSSGSRRQVRHLNHRSSSFDGCHGRRNHDRPVLVHMRFPLNDILKITGKIYQEIPEGNNNGTTH